jgi:type I restriction enzyme S subunit
VTCKGDGDPKPYVSLDAIESDVGRLLDGAEPEMRESGDAVLYQEGDVLFGKLRPYLAKVLAAGEPGCCSSELLVLRPDHARLDPRYLYYVCLSKPLLDWADASSYGVKMPRTSWELLAEYCVDIPPIDEQRRVAAYLEKQCARIDDLIAEQTRQLQLLDERRRTELDRLVLRGCAADRRTRTANVPWPVTVPDDWPVTPLKLCVDDVTVGIVVTPSKYYADTGVPCLRGLNVRPARVNRHSLVYMSDESNREHSKSILRPGDVVVVRTGDAGAAAVVPEWAVGGNAIDLLLVRPGPRMLPKYAEMLINSHLVREQVTFWSVGALQAHFNVEALANARVVCPPTDEQNAIVRAAADATEKVDRLHAEIGHQIALLIEHRQALVAAAVTGQLPIADAA